MNCRFCGKEMPDGAPFCAWCGKKQAVPEHTPKRRGNGQGTVYKRGKTYTAKVTAACYMDGDRLVVKRKSKGGFATRKEAVAYLPILQAQADGTENIKPDMTMTELYSLWKQSHENEVSKSTMTCYTSAWKYYRPIQFYKVKNVKTATLQKCLDECGKGKRTQENMKALGTMLFRVAMSNDIVSQNYAEGLKPHGEKQEPREPFTAKEIEKMWSIVNAPDYDYRTNSIDLVLILCYTGFRLNEFLSLKSSDYHKEDDWSYFIGGEKTEAGKNRIVGIPGKIVPLVERHLGPEYMFTHTGQKPNPRAHYWYDKYYYPALDKAGITRRVPHCCRHTYATMLKRISAADKDKMALIGHASYSMTMEYTHADLEGIKKIVAAL